MDVGNARPIAIRWAIVIWIAANIAIQRAKPARSRGYNYQLPIGPWPEIAVKGNHRQNIIGGLGIHGNQQRIRAALRFSPGLANQQLACAGETAASAPERQWRPDDRARSLWPQWFQHIRIFSSPAQYTIGKRRAADWIYGTTSVQHGFEYGENGSLFRGVKG